VNGEVKNTQKEINALDAYLNRVYRIIILAPPIAAMMASATFTIFKLVGWYAVVNTTALIIFDLSDITYLIIAIYFYRTGFDEEGILRRDKLKAGKIFISLVIVIQWNFISYMVPAREFWAYAFFFILLAVFFFDMKMITCVASGVIISTIISWIINSENLLMSPSEYYMPDFILRIICIVLTTSTVVALTYFGGRFLVEELEKYVNYDTLTHLLNRRSMGNYLKAAKEQAETGAATFCIMMLDIDDFKKVNDTYGHDCGDEVLKFVAGIVSNGVRKQDNVFRWGGEEILVLINANEKDAVEIAEKIRAEIETQIVHYKDNEVSVTATIGISAYASGKNIHELTEDADKKLYYGKRHGKNQVVSDLPSDYEIQS